MVKALEQPRELNGHKVNPANDKLTVLAHVFSDTEDSRSTDTKPHSETR